MARVGFKKTFAAGTFDANAVVALFNRLRQLIAQAGFKIHIDTGTTLDFSRADAQDGEAHDDLPHWAFTLQPTESRTTMSAHAVFGDHVGAENALTHSSLLAAAGSSPISLPEFTLWFAADGGGGGWWCHISITDANSPSGQSFAFACAGITSRRYAADLHQGLCARYGLRLLNGDWYPVYARNESGERVTGPRTASWSPLGWGGSNNSQRHAGSPLPKMAVPLFPAREGGITACLLGEYHELMLLTSGYANEERVLPGWMALVGNDGNAPYAVPAPERFATV